MGLYDEWDLATQGAELCTSEAQLAWRCEVRTKHSFGKKSENYRDIEYLGCCFNKDEVIKRLTKLQEEGFLVHGVRKHCMDSSKIGDAVYSVYGIHLSRGGKKSFLDFAVPQAILDDYYLVKRDEIKANYRNSHYWAYVGESIFFEMNYKILVSNDATIAVACQNKEL